MGGEISKVSFAGADVPKLDDAFTWFVRLAGEVVTIHGLHEGRVREIGRASWVRGRLIEKVGTRQDFPTDHQWKLVGTALARVVRRAKPTAVPVLRRVPRHVIGAVVMGLCAIGATALIFIVRTDDPAPETIAPFDTLLWTDVQHGGETTPALVAKDPARERGRKLCVSGAVDAIKAATVEARKVHVGTLFTAAGDSVPFIALGSARSIARRAPARFCGIAHGKQIVGLFDLPENRALERDK